MTKPKKPVINLDELNYKTHEEGCYGETCAGIAEHVGARKLGYSITIVPPGKRVCPFHNHHTNEEMFFILEGEGTLRFGDSEYPLRQHDVIGCPPGGRDVAHQIINTSQAVLKYLCISTMEQNEVAEYPDSNKVGIFTGPIGNRDLRLMFKAERAVDYLEGEQI